MIGKASMSAGEMELDPAVRSAGYRHIALGQIDSTNAEAMSRAHSGERGPLWITAESQTAGRGRRGHQWISPPGNLHASLMLSQPSSVELAPQLSFVAALAVHDAIIECAPMLGPAVMLKWPNDVLIDGSKLAGLLLESENTPAFSVVVGIGVNCSHAPEGLPYPATSLLAVGAAVPPRRLFSALTRTMLYRLSQWRAGQNFPAIRRDWLARAAGLGQYIHVRLPERELDGRFMGLDENGRLLIQPDIGPHEKIAAGEVLAFGPARR